MSAIRRAIIAFSQTAKSNLWSNPQTWGGLVPMDGDAITIPLGKTVIVDTVTARLQSLTLSGTLVASSVVDSQLKARNVTINSGGRYLSGSAAVPNARSHILTLIGAFPTVNSTGGAVVTGPTHTGPYGNVNTPTGNNAAGNDFSGFYRGLLIMDGGEYSIYGARPAALKAKLGATVAKNANAITLDRPVTWKAGDIVVIESTDFYQATDSGTDRLTVAADVVNSTAVTFTTPLLYNHWGVLQYPQDDRTISLTQGPFTDGLTSSYTASVSLTTMTVSATSSGTIGVGQRVYGVNIAPYTFITALGTGTGGNGTYTVSVSQTAASAAISCRGMRATAATPSVIDQRALVVNCSRGHVVEGDNDTVWSVDKNGAHMMAMGLGCTVVVTGVNFRRVGQRGRLGRYPLHFHMNAYTPATGATNTNPKTGLSDGVFATGQAVIEDCSILDSANRLISLHGCKGVMLKNLFGDNISGHAYFTEDGSERGNTFDSCQVTRVVIPPPADRLKVFDDSSSGFWISNLDNNFITTNGIKNGASDCDGNGYMVSQAPDRPGFPGGCFGASGQVPLSPYYTPPTNWQGIYAHSNSNYGRSAAAGVIDEGGTNDPPNGRTRPQGTLTNRLMTGLANIIAGRWIGDELWKCKAGAVSNAQYIPVYDGIMVADNNGKSFQGLTDFGEQQNCLFVERTLNNANPAGIGPEVFQSATIGYHGSLIPKDCSVFGYDVSGLPAKKAVYRFGGTLFVPRVFVDFHDNYLQPITAFTRGMSNLRLTSEMSMYLSPFPDMTYEPPFTTFSNPQTSIDRSGGGAGAHLDYEGVFFNQGAGRYGLIDHPFITTGAANLLNRPNTVGQYIGMATTTSSMYGLKRIAEGAATIFGSDGADLSAAPFYWQRVNTAFADIAGAGFAARDGDTYGAYTDGGYSAMCTYPAGSWARVYHRTLPTTKYRNMGFELNCADAATGFVGIGIPWRNLDSFVMRGDVTVNDAGSAANQAALLASATSTFWRDTTAQVVWVKMVKPTTTEWPTTAGTLYPTGTLYRERTPQYIINYLFTLT